MPEQRARVEQARRSSSGRTRSHLRSHTGDLGALLKGLRRQAPLATASLHGLTLKTRASFSVDAFIAPGPTADKQAHPCFLYGPALPSHMRGAQPPPVVTPRSLQCAYCMSTCAVSSRSVHSDKLWYTAYPFDLSIAPLPLYILDSNDSVPVERFLALAARGVHEDYVTASKCISPLLSLGRLFSSRYSSSLPLGSLRLRSSN
ncbi:hypothetical protein K488DRAFT_91994 [Vararia minispora EC-137]|uniref:Uncharacterized protein n=1 Tax=Vararia minispora EC-137 TaxID=1314806 RepID=A0ACB8Q5J8_9AGAM|nr:hypothetical protein K488DRAFT_91994 [Vararia minispora EC-137]